MKEQRYRVTVLGADGNPVLSMELSATHDADALARFRAGNVSGVDFEIIRTDTLRELVVTGTARDSV